MKTGFVFLACCLFFAALPMGAPQGYNDWFDYTWTIAFSAIGLLMFGLFTWDEYDIKRENKRWERTLYFKRLAKQAEEERRKGISRINVTVEKYHMQSLGGFVIRLHNTTTGLKHIRSYEN